MPPPDRLPSSHSVPRDFTEDDEDEDEEREARPNDSFTAAEMAHMRTLIITKRRADMLERATETLLGEQYGDGFISFNTSFSYEVVRNWRGLVKTALKAFEQNPKYRFDFLLSWTEAIDSYDCWKHDHEVGYA